MSTTGSEGQEAQRVTLIETIIFSNRANRPQYHQTIENPGSEDLPGNMMFSPMNFIFISIQNISLTLIGIMNEFVKKCMI